jgi:hypothetical protein
MRGIRRSSTRTRASGGRTTARATGITGNIGGTTTVRRFHSPFFAGSRRRGKDAVGYWLNEFTTIFEQPGSSGGFHRLPKRFTR